MKPYTYWRSTAAYRVRIALHYKNISFESISIDLLNQQQFSPDFTKINPQQRIPSIEDNGITVSQSLAILEYLEEAYPSPSILPGNTHQRAMARYIAQIIVSDLHPLNNSGTLHYLRQSLDQTPDAIKQWYEHWLKKGFECLETIIQKESGGQFCVAQTLSIADICLVPQIYNAHQIQFDLSAYPTLERVYNHCLSLTPFILSEPEQQFDCIPIEGLPGAQ